MNKDLNTDPSQEALEVISVLLHRLNVMESLLTGPKDKRELVEAVGISRSTVDRATRELETTGLINYSGGEFSVTPLGTLAATELFGLVETVELGQRLEAFLEWVPMDEFDIDPRLLADAEIVLAEPGDPYAMINKHIELIKNMECCRALLPFTGLHAQEAAYEQIVHHEARGELVVETEVAEVQRSSPAYAELASEMQATGRFKVLEYDGELPYSIVLIDDTTQIIVAEGDEPRALLETDAKEVYEWAEQRYQGYKQDTEQILP